MRDAFAYPAVAAVSGVPVAERTYPITHLAHAAPAAQTAGAKPVAIVIAPHNQGLDDPDPRFAVQGYRHALREVVARCIFGVDRNPMAIELARTALWIEGLEQGRPLSFMDHHLQCGDALLGLTDMKALEHGIAKSAFKALSGDDKAACRELAKHNAAKGKRWAASRSTTSISSSFRYLVRTATLLIRWTTSPCECSN